MADKTSKKAAETQGEANYTVGQLAQQGKNAAIVQAFKNAYLKKIRHDPHSVLGPQYATKLMRMEGDALIEKEYRNTPVFLLTYNPVHFGEGAETMVKNFARSFRNHLMKYRWVQAFHYGVEVTKKKRRPHIHMVIHTKKKRFPSEIVAQCWAMAHNVYHMSKYSKILVGPGHNIKHMDVRALMLKSDIATNMAYIVKGKDNGTLIEEGWFGQSPLLWPDYEEVPEEE